MIGIAQLAATLLLLQHTSYLKGDNANQTLFKENATLVAGFNDNVTNIFLDERIGSQSLTEDLLDLDHLNDTIFDDNDNGNITGRHAYHNYRPTYFPLPPPPPPTTLVLIPAPPKQDFVGNYGPDGLYLAPCKCVPFYLCKVKDIIERTDGEGLIDERSAGARKQTSQALAPTSSTNLFEHRQVSDLNTSSSEPASRNYRPKPYTNSPGCPPNHVCCRDLDIDPIAKPFPPRPVPFPVPAPPSKQIYPPIPPTISVVSPAVIAPPKQSNFCGARNLNGIVGRVKTPVYVEGDTQFGEFPWHVAILKNDDTGRLYICAGTLISDQYVVTAAHSIKGYNPREMRIRLGDWDVSSEAEVYPFVERYVNEVYVHPYFYAGNLQNDIAILRLDQPVDLAFSVQITPACLPPRFETFAGQRCVVTGWGKDAWGVDGQYSHTLKKVDLAVLTNYDCQQKLRYTRLGPQYQLHPGFMCAGGEPGKDACKGDGGGPLVCEYDGRYVLAGIVSWGIGCGLPGVPGVYVRVSEYLEWINGIIYGGL